MPAATAPSLPRLIAPRRGARGLPLASALILSALLLARASAAPGAGLVGLATGRQSGPSQSCECPSRTCPVDQTCFGAKGVGFCSTVGLGNQPLVCTSTATPAATASADAPASPSPEPLGSGMLCLCPRPDCPLGELCFRIRSAGVCYRSKFQEVFAERTCVKPTVTASVSPTPYPVESSAPESPSPSATPTISVSPSVSSSPDSALNNPNSGNQGTFTSVAASASSTASQAPPICVAAVHLAHVPVPALVFPTHRTAHVLCDRAGSCATPGHMVMYNGRAMMMRTYCMFVADEECSVGRTLVNSPKFRRAWRGRSHTAGLEFTAMAARWASPAEEAALTLVLRMGL